MTRFVIFTVPRSGSNMLASLLNSHPDILCHHEVYNPKGVRLALHLRGQESYFGTMTDRDCDPLAFLQKVWQYPGNAACTGFKFSYRQNEVAYRVLLEDTGVFKIVLSRRNELKSYVSYQISDQLGEWEVYDTNKISRHRPKIWIDPDGFYEHVALNKAYLSEIGSYLERTGAPALHLAYEDLFDDEMLAAVLEFLAVPPARLSTPSVKQNSANLEDLVENFDELQAVFQGTEFEDALLSLDF